MRTSGALRRIARIGAGAALVVSSVAWGMGTVAAERVIRGRSAAPDADETGEESAGDLAKMQKQLKEVLAQQDEILANQATMLQKFDAIMEELRIIKVRATIRGGS